MSMIKPDYYELTNGHEKLLPQFMLLIPFREASPRQNFDNLVTLYSK